MPNKKRGAKGSHAKSRRYLWWLLPIILLGMFLTYYPHLNYNLPLYVDEWYHIDIAQYLATYHSLPTANLYVSRFPFVDPEIGFHVMLAVIYSVFHLSMTQWTYLPMIIDALGILSMFYFVLKLFGRTEALLAALLIALLPSNVTIGGPVFLIPVDLALIFIPIALVLEFGLTNLKPKYNYALLLIVFTFVLYAHPPLAAVLGVMLVAYPLMNILLKKKKRNNQKALLLVVLLSLILSIPNYLPYVQSKAGLAGAVSFNFLVYASQIPLLFGVIPTVLFLLGFYLLARKGSTETWTILLGSIVLIVVISTYVNLNFNLLIPYQRAYIPLFVLMSIVAAFGYSYILKIKTKQKYNYLKALVLILLISATIYFSVFRDVNTPYYHLINQTDYSNFVWMSNNLNRNATAILNPSEARAFVPITGMHVYVVEPFGPNAIYSQLINNTDAFFAEKCSDTQFMIQNNISVVYSPTGCLNSNLTEVNTSIYVLK